MEEKMQEKFEALKTANEYIDNLKNGIEDFVRKMNSGEGSNGIAILPLIADGIEWLTNIINLTSDLHNGAVSVGNTKENLEQIIEALENEDYVLLGDLFNYEFLPTLEDIQVNIRKIVLN